MIKQLKDLLFSLFGIRVVRFRRCLKQGDLILRLRRFRDLPVLYSFLTPEILREANGYKPNAFASLVSFWRWLKMTFRMVYVIEVEEIDNRRTIGFAGLYDINLGRSLSFSLEIFSPDDRRQRYGERALQLLLDSLRKNGAAGTIYAEVLKSNVPSLCLCRKLGFQVNKLYQNKFLLEKDQK